MGVTLHTRIAALIIPSQFLQMSFRQVLVVACGSMFLGENIPMLNGIGILIVVIGSFRYGQISIEEKSGSS